MHGIYIGSDETDYVEVIVHRGHSTQRSLYTEVIVHACNIVVEHFSFTYIYIYIYCIYIYRINIELSVYYLQ